MAVLTQRLVIMFLFIVILSGIASEIGSNPYEGNYTASRTLTLLGEETATGTEYEVGESGSSSDQESTLGNAIRMGGVAVRVFFLGLNPFPIHHYG